MFDKIRNRFRNRNEEDATSDGITYERPVRRNTISPIWLLPLLIIPLALFVWGGSQLLRNVTNGENVSFTQQANRSTPNQNDTNNNGLEVGVGGAPNTTVTKTMTPSPTVTKDNAAEAGVGGAPGDTTESGNVPKAPDSGHGW